MPYYFRHCLGSENVAESICIASEPIQGDEMYNPNTVIQQDESNCPDGYELAEQPMNALACMQGSWHGELPQCVGKVGWCVG